MLYDVFYWLRNYGQTNLDNIRKNFPDIKINVVTDFYEEDAHNTCERYSETDKYFFITPDTYIHSTFTGFDKEYDDENTHLWAKCIPNSSDEREYHGLGLYHKK